MSENFGAKLTELKNSVSAGNENVKQREGWRDRNGNVHMVEYVEWHVVADVLDRVAPEWQHRIKGIVQIGDMVAVTCEITIDGVAREGVGTGSAESELGIKKAEHDALKRAAVKFGVARDLYRRESEVIERNGSAPQGGGNSNGMPRKLHATGTNDLVTPKQLGMIRAMCREMGENENDLLLEAAQGEEITTDELSKKAASAFIGFLQDKQKEHQ